jgi:hypothetical protein
MKSGYCVALLCVFLSVMISFTLEGQQHEDPPYGFPPNSRVESWQGRSDQPDIIGHRHIAKETHLKCINAEHHPKHPDDGGACLARFEGGEKYTLNVGESMRAPKDGELFLECLGDKPTRCVVGVW